MPRGEMLTVFCYDIGNDKKRNAIAKILEKRALRVQYSVFECRMTRAKAETTAHRIAAMLDDGDSLRLYVMGGNGQQRCKVYGDGPPIQTDVEFWLF